MRLSAIVITRNEENNIADCIAGLNFCDEIIVIDDYSRDRTAEVARQLGAKVYRKKLNGNYAKQRNYGLDKAKGDWVLFVDADERVSNELAADIEREIESGKNAGYKIRRQDWFMGKKLKHMEAGNTDLLRLAKKDSGKWERIVHEEWKIEGPVGELNRSLVHLSHNDLKSLIKKMNSYSDLHAKANFTEGKRSSLLKIIIFPLLKFINNYFFRLGILDGIHGFVISMFMSFHSYLSWSKLWLLQKKQN